MGGRGWVVGECSAENNKGLHRERGRCSPKGVQLWMGKSAWGTGLGGQQGDIHEREEGLPGAHGPSRFQKQGAGAWAVAGISPGPLNTDLLRKALLSILPIWSIELHLWPAPSNPHAWDLGEGQKAFNPQMADPKAGTSNS